VTPAIDCRVCGAPVHALFEKTVLGRFRARYHRCPQCGFVQTQAPDWLDEAYTEAISAADTGVLARCLHARRVLTVFLHLAGAGNAPCLDWAGGHGVLTRLMRDVGFDFRWDDLYASNLFARGFEWRAEDGPPFAVTAFEVLEHLVHPVEMLREIAALESRFVITSTQLYEGAAPSPEWRYLAPETGQHVGFYSRATIERLGREAGFDHVRASPVLQLFSRGPVPALAWNLARLRGAPLYPLLRRRRAPLTESDSTRMRAERRPR
jgi:hypothetical protein